VKPKCPLRCSRGSRLLRALPRLFLAAGRSETRAFGGGGGAPWVVGLRKGREFCRVLFAYLSLILGGVSREMEGDGLALSSLSVSCVHASDAVHSWRLSCATLWFVCSYSLEAGSGRSRKQTLMIIRVNGDGQAVISSIRCADP
jgi:hypothetical protein